MQSLQLYQPSSQITLRADLTYFKDGWPGSHEFQTGFFGAPRSTYDTTTQYVNNGFMLEEQRQVDANKIRRRARFRSTGATDAGRAADSRRRATGISPSTCRTTGGRHRA